MSQQQQIDQMLQVISNPRIYNDSRDQVLGKFNKLQASWGTGKLYFSRDNAPVDLTQPNMDLKGIRTIGFNLLYERYKMQQAETKQQRAAIRQLSEQVFEMQKHVAAMKSKLEECRRKKAVLGNRVLKVLIMQEIENRRGFPIQADEEKLRSRMESILSELHAQTKYKGCLNELMSQLKQVQNQQHRTPSVHLDESVVEDIKDHLENELYGIEHLIKIIKQDNEIVAQTNNSQPPQQNDFSTGK